MVNFSLLTEECRFGDVVLVCFQVANHHTSSSFQALQGDKASENDQQAGVGKRNADYVVPPRHLRIGVEI